MSLENPTEFFTPSEEEQTALILQGKCPHNQGWRWYAGGHNDDAYVCVACLEMKFW